GVSSNIIIDKNRLFFVARDGFFYSYDIDNNKSKRIVKVDNNPSVDKYLTKNSVKFKDYIMFCSDRGSLFVYDTVNDFYQFVKIADINVSLLASPMVINNDVYLMDIRSNSYKISDFSLSQ
ncbi:MAG TPA: hypothetical protein PK771_12030, partial [Spirochaetota bacterium]|nr:hypothetical protein [Spirochaetota bacterium]